MRAPARAPAWKDAGQENTRTTPTRIRTTPTARSTRMRIGADFNKALKRHSKRSRPVCRAVGWSDGAWRSTAGASCAPTRSGFTRRISMEARREPTQEQRRANNLEDGLRRTARTRGLHAPRAVAPPLQGAEATTRRSAEIRHGARYRRHGLSGQRGPDPARSSQARDRPQDGPRHHFQPRRYSTSL